MARATYHGVKFFAYPKDLLICNMQVQQRYSSWLGNVTGTFVDSKHKCKECNNFTGSDIGGFAEQPSGDLYMRWIQLGVFHPFAEHTRSGDHDQCGLF
jgi:alpha-glucosidase